MEASRSELSRYVHALFKHADPDGWVNLRAFYEEKDRPWFLSRWRSIQIGDDNLDEVVDAAHAIASDAASDREVVVFCPPVCTFRDGEGASETNVYNGLVLLVDCDKHPVTAREKLEALLGPPTLVVASGGIWEGEDKLHLYWRLNRSTSTPEDHALLKQARAYGAKYAATDPTSAPLSHPIRWAGSWHRKATPRMAVVVCETDAEIDLHVAFQLLKNAVGATEEPKHHAATTADPKDIEAAMTVIPNGDLEWEAWNNIGLALWAATNGSADGQRMWEEWSGRSPKDNPRRTVERWKHFAYSPPTRTGAGVLFSLAVKHNPGWRRPGEEAPRFSDEALAIRFADERVHDLRYTAEWNKWYHWTGAYWREDKTLVSMNLVREMCRRASREANKGAKQIASARAVGSVVNLSRADQRIAATTDQWDGDPWLLGTPGGTVDLRHGVLLANGADNYITRVAPVTPTSGNECSLWISTLGTICGGKQPMMDFMQRIAGYFLTGSTREEKMFFLHGGGGNGKGTFIETIAYVLGDYSTTVAMSTLIMTQHSEHPTEIAKLRGVRLAVASETNDAARWNSARIKLLTGGDALTGRFMRGDFFDFLPTHKLVVSSNSRPMLGRVDAAITRRTTMIPFDVTFDVPDTTIKERLRAEAPGILAWMVEGCILWQRWGLHPPDDVVRATEQYLHDQDDIQMFIDERCEEHGSYETASTVLYTNWETWCERNGIRPGSKKDFTQRMMAKFNHRLVQNLTHFIGVRLNPQPNRQEEPDDGRWPTY